MVAHIGFAHHGIVFFFSFTHSEVEVISFRFQRELHAGLGRWAIARGPSDQLADALNQLGESHRLCAEHIHPALTETIEEEFGFRMQEYGQYTEAVQRVLRRRGNVEVSCGVCCFSPTVVAVHFLILCQIFVLRVIL